MHEFTRRYTRLTDDRAGLSLTEKTDKSCVFVTDTGRCMVHAVKPMQCRDFPLIWRFPGYEMICHGCASPENGRYDL